MSFKPYRLIGVPILFSLIGVGIVSAHYLLSYKKICTNDELVCVRYNAGWAQEDLATSKLDKYIDFRLKHISPSANFQITRGAGLGGRSLDTMTETVESGLKKDLSGFELISKRSLRISGKESVVLSYKYSYMNSDGQLINSRQAMAIVPTTDKTVYATLQTDPENYSKVEGDVAFMLRRMEVRL